ncbi:MAG: hypothetical protein JHD16_06015, partial [Solirubrobacteraceae bacterium]|nr:hypothetical protein [Solirubrobacteraceae bacterium]
MFRSSSSRSRLLAAAGATALVAIAGTATPAQAVSRTLNYQCKYPILGTEPMSIKIDIDLPEQWPRGVDTPPFAISVIATAGGDTVPGLALIDDLTSIEGTALASTTVLLPEGGSLKVNVPITVDRYVLPTPVPDPLVLTASGQTPSVMFDEYGKPEIALDKIALNLVVRDSLGDPIVLPPVTRDV